jgi:Conserved TM helix
MNTTWQDITQVMGFRMEKGMGHFLAQASRIPNLGVNESVDYAGSAVRQVIDFLPTLLGAVVILIIGWLIAAIAAAIVKGVLNRTKLDNRIANTVSGGRDVPKVEGIISGLVFWSVLLLTLVAVLEKLNLRTASQPLNAFLSQIGDFLPKLFGAGVLLGLAWVIATVIKVLTINALNALRVDERLNPPGDGDSPNLNQLSLAETIGTALYWFVFLVFLVPLLDTLGLRQALVPVQNLVTQVLGIIPNILGAVLIGATGWFVANIVRRIVTNLLTTTGVDHMGSRFGLSPAAGVQSLSNIVGTIVYVLILIPVAIAALTTLRIDAISIPAISMLQQILNALPLIFTAVTILVLAYFLGRFIADLVTSILTSLGFNNIFSALGLNSLNRAAANVSATTPGIATRTPSELAGLVVLVGVLLFATVAAVNILGIPSLTALVTGILLVMGRILSGLVIFAIGLFFANLAFNLITSSGSAQSQILGQAARISIITLVSAMALQQIGVAPDIVNLAFGLLLGAIAVAIALAFGLGGRDIARNEVQQWINSFKSKG